MNMLYGHESHRKGFEILITNNALRHGYLFYGDAHIGKALFARHILHRLEYGAFEINDKPLFDALWIAPDEKKNIGIDAVRAIKEFLWTTPLQSTRRSVVIDEAHMLTREAQGALLKIVEEPPLHALLIFITHDKDAFPAPLLSRLNRIYFERMKKEKLIEVLVKEQWCAPEHIKKCVEKAMGRIGRAYTLCKEEKNIENSESSLQDILQENIVHFYKSGACPQTVRWLLNRESSLRRYNLNPVLQKKAIEFKKVYKVQ